MIMQSKEFEQYHSLENNNEMNKKYEKYYYVGEHVDGCDIYGPINVYHYISESLLRNRNLKDINFWDCDLELWPGDKLWSKAYNRGIITIELELE